MFHLFTKIDSISTSELEQKLKKKIHRLNIKMVIFRVRRMSHSMKSQDTRQQQMKHCMSFAIPVCGAKWQPKS